MVLAEAKPNYQRSINPATPAMHEPLRRPAVQTAPVVKKRARVSPKTRYVIVWLIGVVLALGLASRFAYAATLSADIRGLEQQLAQTVSENGQLKVQVAELQSLAHIEQVATTRLGMVKPGEARPVIAADPAAVAVASLIDDSGSAPGGGGWLDSLQKWFTQLIRTGRAQAKGL